MQAVLFKMPGQTWESLGGMTLLERNLRLLDEVGVRSALILHPPQDPLPALTIPRTLQLDARGAAIELATADPFTILSALPVEKRRPFFLFDANLLVDQRVLATLSRRPPPCFLVLGNGAPTPPIWRVGWLRSEHIRHGKDIILQAERISLRAVPSYDETLDCDIPPYCQKMKSEQDLVRGWQLLINQASQTSHKETDVISTHLNVPVENWIARAFCQTSITPQHLWLLSVAVALVGVSFFYQGLFLGGVLFAWLSLVLEHVKDKLARVKLLPFIVSPLTLVTDVLIGPSWYLSLASGLASHTSSAWGIGLAVAACEIGDTLTKRLVIQLTGKPLQRDAGQGTASDLVRCFELLSGQRRFYVFVLFFACVFGQPLIGLKTLLGWAVVTLLFHAGRAAHHLICHSKGDNTPSSQQ